MENKNGKARPEEVVKPGFSPQYDELRNFSAEELACLARQGSKACFAELVERYGERLLCFLCHKTASIQDAEDLAQEAFIKAYPNIHRYRRPYKFSTWLLTIAARLAHSRYRKTVRLQRIAEVEFDGPEPAETAAQREEKQNLWDVARGLSKNQYQVLWLKYAEDMPIKEISRVMKKSQVHIRVLLYRSRVNMAARLRSSALQNEKAVQTAPKRHYLAQESAGV